MTLTIFGRLPDNDIKATLVSAKPTEQILGVRFPLYDKESNAKGIFNKTDSFELLKSELRQFIRTERSERVMLPNFGLSLKRFLFEPITNDLLETLNEEILFGITSYLPEAEILDLRIQEGDNISGLGLTGIKISLLVTQRNTTQQGLLEINL